MSGLTLRAAAVAYARKGRAVFPVHGMRDGKCTCRKDCPRPGKHPVASAAPNGVKDATSDTATVDAWWERYPWASIGMACGEASGVWVLDVDVKAPKPKTPDEVTITGVDALAQLEALHGALPSTLEARTGGGGRHLFFVLTKGRTVRNKVALKGLNGERTGLDVRSAGGYVILAPSPHVSGGSYAWNEPKLPCVEAPAWLLELLDPPAAPTPSPAPRPSAPPVGDLNREQRYARRVLEYASGRIRAATEGSRHETIRNEAFCIGGFIRFLDEGLAVDELVAAGVDAGKPERDVRRLVVSGIQRGREKPRDVPAPEPDTRGSSGGWEGPPPPDDQDMPPDLDRRGARDPGPPASAGEKSTDELLAQAGMAPGPQDGEDLHAGLPTINITQRQGRLVIEDSWMALLAANRNPPRLFSQGGRLARLHRSEQGTNIALCEPVHVHGMLMRTARWMRWKKAPHGKATSNGYEEVDAEQPPAFVAADMVAAPARSLPVLEQVVYSPVFNAQGQLLGEPGYHPSAHLWYEEVRPIEPQPMSLAEARALLDDWLADFPFATQADRAHAIGLFLLPFVRRLIDGPTPVHLVEAPMPGTGKTLLGRVLVSAALGREVPLSPFDRDEKERKKAITAALIAGRQVIFYDNVKGRVDSESFEQATTSMRWADRLLGISGEIEVPILSIWLMTANNATMSPDLVRRTVRMRLARLTDEPFDPDQARHPDIVGWTLENHASLTSAAVVLVGTWLQAGRPRCSRSLGSYEAWARVVGGVLEHAGIEGFLQGRESFEAAADPLTAEWRQLVKAWQQKHGASHVTAKEVLQLADAHDLLAEVTLHAGTNEKARATMFGKALRARVDAPLGGHRIVAKKVGGVSGYRLIPSGKRDEDVPDDVVGRPVSAAQQEDFPW